MGKRSREWRHLYTAAVDLADRRGEALARVWLVIESQVDDASLANALRMAIIGDFVPDVVEEYEPETPEKETPNERADDG